MLAKTERRHHTDVQGYGGWAEHLEQRYGQVVGDDTAVQERCNQLEERLGSSQICGTSAAESDRPEKSLPSQAAPSGQWDQVLSRVSCLTDGKMQDQHLAVTRTAGCPNLKLCIESLSAT